MSPPPCLCTTRVTPATSCRTEIIEAHGLSVIAAAKVFGVSRPAPSNLLNQNADLSGEMALRYINHGGRAGTMDARRDAFSGQSVARALRPDLPVAQVVPDIYCEGRTPVELRCDDVRATVLS